MNTKGTVRSSVCTLKFWKVLVLSDAGQRCIEDKDNQTQISSTRRGWQKIAGKCTNWDQINQVMLMLNLWGSNDDNGDDYDHFNDNDDDN